MAVATKSFVKGNRYTIYLAYTKEDECPTEAKYVYFNEHKDNETILFHDDEAEYEVNMKTREVKVKLYDGFNEEFRVRKWKRRLCFITRKW